MASVTASLSKKCKLAFGSTSTVDKPLSFSSFSHGCSRELLNVNRDISVGALSPFKEKALPNRRIVRPRFSGMPTFAEWRSLLPLLFHGSESGSGPYTYALGSAAVTRYWDLHSDTKYFQLSTVGVMRWTLRARSGGPAELDIELVGCDYTNTGSIPSLTIDADGPLLMKALALSINSTTTYCQDFSLSVSYDIDTERFFNQDVLAGVVLRARDVEVSATLPLGQHHALWDAAIAASVAVTATFTPPGGGSLLFSMPAVKSSPESWDARSPDELTFSWKGNCLRSSVDGDELSATVTLPG